MSDRFQYGGQAVIEGVMMRGRRSLAIAVRRPDKEIVVDTRPMGSLSRRYPTSKASSDSRGGNAHRVSCSGHAGFDVLCEPGV